MKTSTRDILFIFIGLFISIGTVWASRAGVEMRLGKDVAYLNNVGRSASGERSLSRSLQEKFGADAAQIEGLRKQRLGYGDISVVMALASRLHGGISRLNIERIVSRWRAPRSGDWARIARSMGVRVDRVVLQIESLTTRENRTSVGTTAARTTGTGTTSSGTAATGTTAARSRSYDPVWKLVHGG